MGNSLKYRTTAYIFIQNQAKYDTESKNSYYFAPISFAFMPLCRKRLVQEQKKYLKLITVSPKILL